MDKVIGQDYRTPGEVRAMSNGERHMVRITGAGEVTFDPDLVVSRDEDTITLTASWAGDASIIVSPLSIVSCAEGRTVNLYDVITQAFPVA